MLFCIIEANNNHCVPNWFISNSLSVIALDKSQYKQAAFSIPYNMFITSSIADK